MPQSAVAPPPAHKGASLSPEPMRLLVLTTVDLGCGLPQRTHHLIRVMSSHVAVTAVDVRGIRKRSDWWYKLSRSIAAEYAHRKGPIDETTIEATFSAFSPVAPLGDIQVIRFFRKAVKSAGQRWDICLAQGPICGAAAVTLKGSRLFDALVYEDLDDFPAFFPSRPLERKAVAELENLSLRSADLVVSVSNLLAARARDRGARQVVVVPNGSDWSAFSVPHQLPPPCSTIYVGSLEPWAGLELAVEAVALLRTQGHDATLRIYGKGQSATETRLRRAIERTGAGKSISLEGVVDYSDLPRVLTQARVGLVPFAPGPLAAHAFPLKLIEYLSGGLSVVGTRVGELGRVLAELPGGRAVDYTSVSFADAIAEMSETLTLDQMMRNRAAVADYDWPVLFDREWQLIGETWRSRVAR